MHKQSQEQGFDFTITDLTVSACHLMFWLGEGGLGVSCSWLASNFYVANPDPASTPIVRITDTCHHTWLPLIFSSAMLSNNSQNS